MLNTSSEMSNTLFLDDTNGNLKSSPATINKISPSELTTSLSNEDLSQSLSEYTDADESMSAPTEFLSEFLSAVMLKDYKKALKYCKLILQYEPQNSTAKEFYPLIQEKLRMESLIDNDENYNNKLLSQENPDEENGCEHSTSENSAAEEDDSNDMSEGLNDDEGSSEDSIDEPGEEEVSNSVSNNSSHNVMSSDGISSDNNTTHSYSSLLLEDEDEPISQQNSNSSKDHIPLQNLDVSNGNFKSTNSLDSESPTEPLTQRLAAIFRSKYIPGNK